jgi:hypothetical protein
MQVEEDIKIRGGCIFSFERKLAQRLASRQAPGHLTTKAQ